MTRVRIQNQPAFVLHQYPYSETSLILDVFTQNYGRCNLIAKGAKRPNSALRSVLQIFQPLIISYSGAGDVKTLTKAEWVNGILPIADKYLISAYYMNELICSGCAKNDAYMELFNSYLIALTEMSLNKEINFILRRFEKEFLLHMGFGIYFNLELINTLDETHLLVYKPNFGFKVRHTLDSSSWPLISKQELLNFIHNDYSSNNVMIKSLLRFMINYHFNKQLKTKKVLQEINKYYISY